MFKHLYFMQGIGFCSKCYSSANKHFFTRNAVALAAREMWLGNDIPTFQRNEANQEKLRTLVQKLLPECQLLPFFGEKAIRQNILDSLTECRRNIKKGYNDSNVRITLLQNVFLLVNIHCTI